MLALGFPNPIPVFIQNALFVSLGELTHYLFFAGVAWLLGYVLCRSWWWNRKVVQKTPSGAEMRREVMWSVLTVVINGLVTAITLSFYRSGWIHIYIHVDDYSRAWFWGSIVVLIFMHDAYFYWTHRLIHHPRLFRLIHGVHHGSRNPSPWAAYCFSPLEATIHAGIFPIALLIMPIHLEAFGLFMLWQIAFNVAGHTGYEFHGSWLMDSWLGKFLNTPTNHVQHHDSFKGNYGLYFNYWDRWMGTLHPDYDKRFREVTSRSLKEPRARRCG
jgi:sterol desaturase/sphingolipid hydroxylase (fatty acid hydroxylase superfamily)